jgi:hypothetical protein
MTGRARRGPRNAAERASPEMGDGRVVSSGGPLSESRPARGRRHPLVTASTGMPIGI